MASCEGQSISQSAARSRRATLLFDLLPPLSGRRQYTHTVCLPSLSPPIGHSSTISRQPSIDVVDRLPVNAHYTVRPYGFLTLWVRSICPRSQVGCKLQQQWPRRGQSQSPSLCLPWPLSSQLWTSRVSASCDGGLLQSRALGLGSQSSLDSPFSPGWLRHESTIRSTSCSASIVIKIGLANLSTPMSDRARHRGSECV